MTDNYTKGLEEQLEQLQQKLSMYEQLADLRKFFGTHGKVANSILTKMEHHIDINQHTQQVTVGGQHYYLPNGRRDVTVNVNLTYVCDDDGSKIVEFLKELSNCNMNY
jgi:Mor family transcriptional regulator